MLGGLHQFLRDVPQVLAVVEDLRIAHVVGGVHIRLVQKQRLRVAPVLAQHLRHRLRRFEEVGEDARIGGGDGVIRVDQIKVNLACIGVDGDFDAVADVVDAAERFGVGEVVRPGVGIE